MDGNRGSWVGVYLENYLEMMTLKKDFFPANYLSSFFR